MTFFPLRTAISSLFIPSHDDNTSLVCCPSSGGGIVRYRQWVKNQRGETIMEYDVARLIRGAAEDNK